MTAIIVGIILITILILIFSSSGEKMRPEDFLQRKKNFSTNERQLLGKAREMLKENASESQKMYLQSLIDFYDKGTTNSISASELQTQAYQKFITAFEQAAQCDQIWFITASELNTTKSAGTFSVVRKRTSFAKSQFNHVRTTVSEFVPEIRDMSHAYFFYPHCIVKAKSGISFEVFPIERIRLSCTPQRFVEEPYEFTWPKDGTTVAHTYQYINKDGTPDRRYASNKKVPVNLYGKITIEPLGLTYHLSNCDAANSLAITFHQLRQSLLPETEEQTNAQPLPTSTTHLDNLDPLFESAARLVVSSQQASTSMIQRNFSIGYNRAGRLLDQLERQGVVGPYTKDKGHKVLCNNEAELQAILRGESAPTPHLKIQSLLDKVEDLKHRTEELNRQQEDILRNNKAQAMKESPMAKLQSLIGLSGVKEEIKMLSDHIKIQHIRKQQGLKTTPISYHCIFTGNPGTGKTTVARIVAEIYKELGILSKGHLVETDRSGLVAEYVGQTAIKTNKIIDSALDGVLFIDEAYALAQGGNNDYGLEAIATLLKRMEDDRDRLVVILAGYGDEMRQFIYANPGLQSRFNRYIHFDDYTAKELYEIFDLNARKAEYIIAPEAERLIKDRIAKAVQERDKNFGNARFIRNFFEKVIENQSVRLIKEPSLSKKNLQLITESDV